MRRGGTYLVEDGFGLAQLATMQTGIFQSTLSALRQAAPANYPYNEPRVSGPATHNENTPMYARILTIFLLALASTTALAQGTTYSINGIQYEDIGHPHDFLVEPTIFTENGVPIKPGQIVFKVTAPYAFSSFHVEVTNLFWGLSDHYYGNDGVRRSGGTYIEPVAFSATNTSFAWQASGNQFWSSQERGGAPLYNYFAVTSPGFSDSNTFKYRFDRAVTSVPEPAVFLQLSAGLVMLGAFTRRRRPRNPAPQSI